MKPSLTLNLGTNGLKVTSEPPPMPGQAGRLQGQDRSAVTYPSSGHARRCLIWLSCDNRRTRYTVPLAVLMTVVMLPGVESGRLANNFRSDPICWKRLTFISLGIALLPFVVIPRGFIIYNQQLSTMTLSQGDSIVKLTCRPDGPQTGFVSESAVNHLVTTRRRDAPSDTWRSQNRLWVSTRIRSCITELAPEYKEHIQISKHSTDLDLIVLVDHDKGVFLLKISFLYVPLTQRDKNEVRLSVCSGDSSDSRRWPLLFLTPPHEQRQGSGNLVSSRVGSTSGVTDRAVVIPFLSEAENAAYHLSSQPSSSWPAGETGLGTGSIPAESVCVIVTCDAFRLTIVYYSRSKLVSESVSIYIKQRGDNVQGSDVHQYETRGRDNFRIVKHRTAFEHLPSPVGVGLINKLPERIKHIFDDLAENPSCDHSVRDPNLTLRLRMFDEDERSISEYLTDEV
ncbi:hypothetical protein J6590_000703 [Homalodisca vitripennis]|nr:hypothetical protein J6590_000703 [Homalodisca vitripennis]